MRTRCLTLLLTAAVAAVAPAGIASAATEPSDLAGELATRSAELLAEEQELVLLMAGAPAAEHADLAQTRVRLHAVDSDAAELLEQLDLLGIELTEAIRTAMDRLPQTSAGETARLAPPSVVYNAAIDDLLRIAATPAAVTPTTDGGSGQTFGLLAVAALALTVLGAAALTNALRPHRPNEELAALAWSDGLTGLANRRRLDADLAATSATDIGPMAAIMIDVDHFKTINDLHGHQVGDDVLRRLASLLSDNVRRDDVVYRYGGEEFCIILPGASIDEAWRVGHRIVGAARTITLPDGSHVTVSVGVADGTGETVSGTLQSADRALYAAKQRGRDQAMTADALLATTHG